MPVTSVPPATPTAPPPSGRRPPGRHPNRLRDARSWLTYTWNNSPHSAWRAARRIRDGRGGPVQVIVSRADPDQVSFAYLGLPIGEVNILQFLEHQRALQGGPTRHRERTTARWRDLNAGHWPDADLIVVGAEARRVAHLPEGRSLTAPFRVHLVVDLPATFEQLQQQVSKRERWQFRRNQKQQQWVIEEDASPEGFAFFYTRMHAPTMERRHGDRSRTESFSIAYDAILRHGTLFFVTRSGERVAGVLCHWSADRRTLTTRLLGVLDGRDEHYEAGAFKAVYHLLLQWACEHGVPRVDFFGTEAFFSKGIFQWKRKFSPRVELPPNHFATKRVRLYVRRDTAAVRDFLVANPLLCLDASGVLQPVYFTDAQRQPRLDISSQCSEMPEPRTVDLDTFLAPDAAPAHVLFRNV